MYEQRVKRLREKLKEKNIESLLISNFYNVLYLTGFKTLTTDEREAFVLVTNNNMYLFTDERYLSKNDKFQMTNFKLKLIEPGKGLIVHLLEITSEEKIKTLGFEAEDLRFYEYQKIKEMLQSVILGPTDKIVASVREFKDQEEMSRVEKACQIGDQCLLEITKIIKQDISEREIAFKIEMWIKEKGYDLAFDPIVGIDVNSSLPHYNTKEGNGRVKKGSVILIDFGVKYKDYLSDVTRMFFFGEPSQEIIHIYNVLLNAQEKTIKELSIIESLRETDEFCRKEIIENKLPNYPHSTGHGVGLEIHEYPKVSMNSPDLKKEDQVFTIEPGVYFPEKYGLRIEDTVAIDKDLKPRILTQYSKSLMIL
ncbi:aminopeptidase P family protein [Candidatus Roizmanbacteria bacterium]|nr:aminopeptidase P family protein [Candidatus Roizmanbacteria bacterium]